MSYAGVNTIGLKMNKNSELIKASRTERLFTFIFYMKSLSVSDHS